jgi:hypothetical protein
VWEAGTHQSLTLQPGHHYLGFVAFGLGALVFLVSISDSSAAATELALDRHWTWSSSHGGGSLVDFDAWCQLSFESPRSESLPVSRLRSQA